MKRFVLRPEDWEKERTDKGSECAKKIREEIERLSPFEVRPIGVAVESGYDPNLDVTSNHLDYEVLHNGNRIAEIDPTCSNYTFEGSRIMPVNYYKGEIIKGLDVPAFIIFSMEKENQPLGDRCVWIQGRDVIKSESRWLPTDSGRKLQYNHMTNKSDWHRGLRSLVDELLKIAKASDARA